MKKILLKHKKLLVRIGSILACLLLVGALVLPCFALDQNSSYYDVVLQAVNDLGIHNSAFDLIMDNKRLQNTTDEFNYWLSGLTTVFTGGVYNASETEYVKIYHALFSDGSEMGLTFASYCSFAVVVEQINERVYSAYCDTAEIAISFSVMSDGTISGAFGVRNLASGEELLFGILVGNYGDDGLETRVVSFGYGDNIYSLTNYDISIFVGFTGETANASNAGRILLNDDTAYPFSPKSLLTGWGYGSNEGGGASQEELDAAYQNGYNEGYNIGTNEDFGATLLGDTFAAPFEALNSFVLFEWTDNTDQHHVVTLAAVIGAAIGITLFVWFLKLFSGG